jgi:hypothetical protein
MCATGGLSTSASALRRTRYLTYTLVVAVRAAYECAIALVSGYAVRALVDKATSGTHRGAYAMENEK